MAALWLLVGAGFFVGGFCGFVAAVVVMGAAAADVERRYPDPTRPVATRPDPEIPERRDAPPLPHFPPTSQEDSTP